MTTRVRLNFSIKEFGEKSVMTFGDWMKPLSCVGSWGGQELALSAKLSLQDGNSADGTTLDQVFAGDEMDISDCHNHNHSPVRPRAPTNINECVSVCVCPLALCR